MITLLTDLSVATKVARSLFVWNILALVNFTFSYLLLVDLPGFFLSGVGIDWNPGGGDVMAAKNAVVVPDSRSCKSVSSNT